MDRNWLLGLCSLDGGDGRNSGFIGAQGAEQARTRYGECTYQQDADQPNEQGDEDWHDIQQ